VKLQDPIIVNGELLFMDVMHLKLFFTQ